MRLPHGADLPLPAYQSAGAAGLDLHAAVPADAPVTIEPGKWVPSRPASRSHFPKAPRAKCGLVRDWLLEAGLHFSTRRGRSMPTIGAKYT